MSGSGSSPFVSVVAPLCDDADIVDAFLDETMAVLEEHYRNFELVLVDDGSVDATVSRADRWLRRSARVRLMRLSRRFGTEIAISAGLETTIGDVVVVLMPETDPPKRIPEFVSRAAAGAGLVFGVRTSRVGQPSFLRVGTLLFYWFVNRILHLGIPPNSTHFRAMQRPVVNAVLQIRDQLRYLRTLGASVGYGEELISYEPLVRRTPPRRKSLREALSLAMGIVVSNSVEPLIAMATVTFATGVVTMLIAIVSVLRALFSAEPIGGISMILDTVYFIGGMIAIVMGMAAAYLARLVGDSRGRPLYFVREERGGAPDVAIDARERNVVADSLPR